MRYGRWRFFGAVLGVVGLLAGCGGASKMPGSASPSNIQTQSSYGGGYGRGYGAKTAPSTPGAGAYDEAPPPAPTSTSAQNDTTSPQPTERPGLGTEWGESRSSHVRDVSFFRADPDRPFANATLFYNDREGVEALSSYHGGAQRFFDYPTRGGAVTISIHGGGGDPLEALNVGERTYVIGQAGERYSIALTNHTNHRFEIVATVDGLDVINGRPGSLDNRGYVLLPYASLDIDGFRQSQDEVAAFRFGRVADSYAAQTGSARNVGVIGVALFSERGDEYSDDELRIRDTANPFPTSDPRFAQPPR
jgi:hypothetical protein